MYNFFKLLFRHGVIGRETVKNYPKELTTLMRSGYICKKRKKKYVFFELTPKALPLLEDYRQILLHRARLQRSLKPHSSFYQAILDDLRFLDENNKEANQFLFLSDWQLKRPTTEFQLKLSQHRFYEKQNLDS